MEETIARLQYPTLEPDLNSIRALFDGNAAHLELRNPHRETPVSDTVRNRARSSAVLIPIVEGPEPTVLVTRRTSKIRFGGHICFPGGTRDDSDDSAVATALRETQEEISLSGEFVEVLGELGPYYTQAGFRITPVIGLVKRGFKMEPNPEEVEQIYQISLRRILDATSYQLNWHTPKRGHYAYHEGDVRVAGPTVSLLIGLYETLLRNQGFVLAAS